MLFPVPRILAPFHYLFKFQVDIEAAEGTGADTEAVIGETEEEEIGAATEAVIGETEGEGTGEDIAVIAAAAATEAVTEEALNEVTEAAVVAAAAGEVMTELRTRPDRATAAAAGS